jgi:pilus assembly protein Flp/PilA
MYQLYAYLKSLAAREEGQDLLEYALLIALIAIICIGAITLAGQNVLGVFNTIAGAI